MLKDITKKAIVGWIIVIIVIWLIITGFWWAFGTKIEQKTVCLNSTYPSLACEYHIDSSHPKNCTFIEIPQTNCYPIDSNRMITLKEVIEDQYSIINNFENWMLSHKVI